MECFIGCLVLEMGRGRGIGDADEDGEREADRKKREKRRKEKQQYKSAELIVDSDAEMGDMDDFLAKERALRQKTAALAASTGHVATMRSHGMRKRRRKGNAHGRRHGSAYYESLRRANLG